METRGLNELGYKIFLDRYSWKDATRQTLQVGDLVLVKVDDNTGQKEIGNVTDLMPNQDKARVELLNGESDEYPIEYVDKPMELDPAQMWERVANAMAENEWVRKDWFTQFKWLLEDWKFIPGGRILAAAGTNTELTYYNCYVLPSPHDSKEGIFITLNHMAQIMARGGGVGINLSSLRPRYSYARSTNGRSSGAVSWGELYSYTTGLIEQGGSRRGALMLILNDWHPDLLEFINVKQDMKRIINANISIGISNAFMHAVEHDEDWTFRFPDTTHPDYDNEWDGDLMKWVVAGRPVKNYKTVKARVLWKTLIASAWACAEPGLWFKGQAERYSNSHYYAPLICTNPCGEQPLPGWSVCLLGSLNLSKFVQTNTGADWEVNWGELYKAVRVAVRFMDNVIDTTPYIYPEMEQQQKRERRIGLGTMGLAEMLVRLKLRYGSPEALAFVDNLYHFIARAAYDTSADLAMEKGAFPAYEDAMLTSDFMCNLLADDDELREKIITHGLRNVTLLTQAPTGTIGTMANTSTGIEPFYFWSFERKGQLGSHMERVKVYDEWINSITPKQREAEIDKMLVAHGAYLPHQLPDYFITAQDLTPEEHVRMQAIIQKWVDSSISKTCNVPNNYTIEQVGELYRLMYDLGCKGGTVYRDGSRDVQVLNLSTDIQKETNSGHVEVPPAQLAPKLEWRKRPANMDGRTYRRTTPVGTAYITVNHNGTGEPFEVFINVGKAGSDVAADAEGLGRLISTMLRMPSTLSVKERIDNIVAQLGGIGSGRQQGFGKNRIMSLADAVAQALMEHTGASEDLPKLPEYDDYEYEHPKTMYFNGDGDMCPGCGNASLMRVEGCRKCYGCGYSEC